MDNLLQCKMSALETLVSILIQQYFNSSCVVNIADDSNYLISNSSVFIINSKQVLENPKIPQCQNFLLNVDFTLKVVESIEDFIRKNSTYSYNKRKYLIVLRQNDGEVGAIFKERVFTFIPNALLIKPMRVKINGSNTDDLYDLYVHNYKEQRSDNAPVLVNTWFAANGSFLWDNIDLYPNRAWKLCGREFINAFVNNPPYIDVSKHFRLGSEYKAMKEFAKYYNMTFVDAEAEIWGDFTANWNATPHSVKSLFLRDEVDVYYGSALLTEYSLQYASLSHPYMRMSFKCLVPEPKEENDWLLALCIKSYKFWLLLLASYTVFAILIIFQKQLSSEKGPFNKLQFFGITLSQSVSVKDLATTTLMRCIFLELCLLSMIFATIYNSNMSSLITIPKYGGRIDTIHDMVTRNLRWTAPTQGYAIPLQDYNRKLYNLFFLSSSSEILNYLRREEHVGFAFIELTSRYYDLKSLNIPELAYYNVLHDDFIVDFTYFHLRKNSALVEAMNQFLLQVTESGLHVYWETESYYASNLLLSYARLKDIEDKVLRPLNLDKLKGHFIVWFVGMVISAVKFGYELSNDIRDY